MGVLFMKGVSIEERAINLAHYIIETKTKVRGAAKKFGVSKSTVHKDVSERLIHINHALAMEVREILDENKAERHIRGGLATKLKYEKEHNHIFRHKI
jgi:putative DeoR family transcriptional regulator (stage III sporulation protein D)